MGNEMLSFATAVAKLSIYIYIFINRNVDLQVPNGTWINFEGNFFEILFFYFFKKH